jgi:hypothetical protein
MLLTIIVSVTAIVVLVLGQQPCHHPDHPTLAYIHGDYGYEEANDACMSFGMRLAAVDPSTRHHIAPCFRTCSPPETEHVLRTWVAGVDGLAGDPCAYITSLDGESGALGVVLGVGTAVCGELSGSALCEHRDDTVLVDTKSSSSATDGVCSRGPLHVLQSKVPFEEAEAACKQHGWTLADYTSGVAPAIISLLQECSPKDPTGFVRSVKGRRVSAPRPCVIVQVIQEGDGEDGVVHSSRRAVSVSSAVTDGWCEGAMVPVCQDHNWRP